MIFTQHALDKLDVYGIAAEWVDKLVESPIYDFFDMFEGSRIKIVNAKEVMMWSLSILRRKR